jgi:hypothetical protein
LSTTIRNIALSVALLGTVAAAAPAWAQTEFPTGPAQATFYEVTENMRLVAKKKPRRVAQSALIGTAMIGTPFCPTSLVRAVSASAQLCTLNALGEDDVNLDTGVGTFDAKLTVVVQGDNPVDPPEFVVAKLRASGVMNFAPAILNGLPYGTITGRVHLVGSDDNPTRFVGVFRLPFLASPAVRGALCPATPNANPNMPQDLAYVDSGSSGQLNGSCLDIRMDELSLGFPAVRFDLWFL